MIKLIIMHAFFLYIMCFAGRKISRKLTMIRYEEEEKRKIKGYWKFYNYNYTYISYYQANNSNIISNLFFEWVPW